MNEISYKTYCMYGAFRNCRLCYEELYGANGQYIKTRYYHLCGLLYYPLH